MTKVNLKSPLTTKARVEQFDSNLCSCGTACTCSLHFVANLRQLRSGRTVRCWRARRLEQRRSNAPTLQVLAGSFAGKLPAASHKTGNKMLRSRRRRASAPRGAGEAQEGGASAGFPEDAATLQRLLVVELRGELRRRGLPVSGPKAALVQRLCTVYFQDFVCLGYPLPAECEGGRELAWLPPPPKEAAVEQARAALTEAFAAAAPSTL